MRALPTIDIPPQPVPAAPDTASHAHARKSGEDFATTLQRRSAKDDQPADDHQPPDAVAKEAAPARPKAEDRPAEVEAEEPDQPAPTVAAPVIAGVEDTTPDASVLAALVALTMPAAVVPDEQPLAAATADELLVPLVPIKGALPTTPVATLASDLPLTTPVVAALPQNEDPAGDAATVPTPILANTAAIAPATATATATAEVSTIAGTTVPTPVTNPVQSAVKLSDQPAVAVTANAKTSEVPSDSALPPVTPAETTDQVTSTPTTTTPAPATPPTSPHLLANAAADRQAKSDQQAESTATTVKPSGEQLPQVSTPTQAPVTTQVKPLSDTVLAQNQLAQQGNAMEKAVSHQVAKALVQNLPNGDRMMVLRLTPPELGTVRVELIERQGVLSARLHAEDDGVRLALERFLPAMRQDLRASDAPIRELNMSDQAQFHRSFADGQQQGQQQDGNRPGNRRQRDDAPRFTLDGVTPQAPLAAPRAAPLGGRVSLSGVDAHA